MKKIRKNKTKHKMASCGDQKTTNAIKLLCDGVDSPEDTTNKELQPVDIDPN